MCLSMVVSVCESSVLRRDLPMHCPIRTFLAPELLDCWLMYISCHYGDLFQCLCNLLDEYIDH